MDLESTYTAYTAGMLCDVPTPLVVTQRRPRIHFEIGNIVRPLGLYFGDPLYEVIGKRRGEIRLYGLTNYQRAWCNTRTYDGDPTFEIVANVWPSQKAPLSITDKIIKLKRMRKAQKQEFYDLFQIGVEIEGSFVNDEDDIEECSEGYFSRDNDSIKEDGSISDIGEGYAIELVTPIITSEEEEKSFVDAVKSIETTLSDYKGFAYVNSSAGTHIHLDFNHKSIERLKELGYKGEISRDLLLRIFDSVDFERFFFEEYFKAFRLQKFWKRLQNSYCKPFIGTRSSGQELNEYRALNDIEREKGERDRYRWLNVTCLREHRGIEFRIFPYIQTTKGLLDVIEFTQAVVLRYFKKKGTKKNIEMIQAYHEGKLRVNETVLSKYDRVLFASMNTSRNEQNVSFDLIEFLAYLAKKDPSCIVNQSNY